MTIGSNIAPRYKIPKAVSMYHEKRAPKILLCGGKEWDTVDDLRSEAQMMKIKALEFNVEGIK